VTPRRRSLLLLAGAVLAACVGSHHAPPASAPQPAPVPAPHAETADPIAKLPAPPAKIVRLENGVAAIITSARAGKPATLQFGLAAGSSFLAPGAAELAVHVLVDGADPNSGRASLRSVIAGLGGTLQTEVGPLSTWIDLRVPGDRWRQALTALRGALESPPWSRLQIERIRDRVVAERTAALRADPAAGMAKLLLLGETSSASHVLSLLDRDPGEVTSFLVHACRPDRAMLALEIDGDAAAIAADIDKSGSVAFGAWSPPPPPPGALPMLDRKFESGLYWSPAATPEAAKDQPCRVAVVTLFAGPGQIGAPEVLAMLACLSLDGTGGRLEQLQRERGLGDVRWRSSIVRTPDATGVMFTTEVAPQDAAALWRTLELARHSFVDLPPTNSEIAMAQTRVPLTARLVTLDDGARVRLGALMAVLGTGFAAFDKQVAMLHNLSTSGLERAANMLLAQPFAMVVVGGEPPADMQGVRRFEVLPAGQVEATAPVATHDAPAPAGKPQPWLDQACEAVGGAGLLRRLDGWRSDANVANADAPSMNEVVDWSAAGSLQRTRTLLGQKIETKLAGQQWSESLGQVVRSLDAREAALLRREMQRHPLALLAAYARGELSFRTVAQRDAGDRTMAVLEAQNGDFDRLRVHVDVESHLVRTVETWETLPDGTPLHVADAWQDYRSVGQLRVPFRCLTTQDNGQNRIEHVFTKWTPLLRAP
jgi:hypothetical protein